LQVSGTAAAESWHIVPFASGCFKPLKYLIDTRDVEIWLIRGVFMGSGDLWKQ
jgi:hypothetical protein